jgi:protease secretion system membrane fusion protein
VVVSGKRKAVQSMAAGVVSRILVSEGQQVRQGEPLFRLDRTQVQADVDALQAQYRMSRASLARWQSERDNLGQLQFPAELSADADPRLGLILEGQRQLFDSRRQALAREQGALAASIDGSQAQLAGMRRARGDLQAQADSLREQLDSLRPLAGEGYIPRNRVLEYQRQLSQVQRDLAQNAGESARLEQVIVEARLNLQQRREVPERSAQPAGRGPGESGDARAAAQLRAFRPAAQRDPRPGRRHRGEPGRAHRGRGGACR